MTLQELLNETLIELKSLVDYQNKNKKVFLDIFGTDMTEDTQFEKLKSMSDEDFEKYYHMSQISHNVKILATKVSDILYIGKTTNVELELGNITEIQGLSEYISEYKPYQLDFSIMGPDITILDSKSYYDKLKLFKENLMKFVFNETRD